MRSAKKKISVDWISNFKYRIEFNQMLATLILRPLLSLSRVLLENPKLKTNKQTKNKGKGKIIIIRH